MKVLVLLGGDSPEKEISIRGGKAVLDALTDSGAHETRSFDPEDLDGLADAVAWADVVLPIVHGVNCEDGRLQERLEQLNAKFLGSSSSVSAKCFDKKIAHKEVESLGIVMPKYKIVTINDLDDELFKKPFVLKPVNVGSSIDTLIARVVDEQSVDSAKKLLAGYDKMLLEELIPGIEITVGILDDEVLPTIAIIPPEGEEFDLDNKYNGRTQEICPAPDELVADSIQKRAQEIALRIHEHMGCIHLSRTDFIVTPEGDIVTLEINTIPGLTAQSLLPKAANAAGYNMGKVVEKFVEMAKRG